MPVITCLDDKATGYCEQCYDPSVPGMDDLYDALRERLSPARLLRRLGGRWVLKAPPTKS